MHSFCLSIYCAPVGLTAHQLCTGDLKEFTFNTAGFSGSVGFGVIETVDDEVILARKAELLAALAEVKAERNQRLLFLAVVNITPPMHSTLLLAGPAERSLALLSFPSLDPATSCMGEDDTVMDLGNRVSRKKEFVPNITLSINKEGWIPPFIQPKE